MRGRVGGFGDDGVAFEGYDALDGEDFGVRGGAVVYLIDCEVSSRYPADEAFSAGFSSLLPPSHQ